MNVRQDRLATLGTGFGALLVLIGLATIAGQPWTVNGLGASAGKLLGAVLAIGIGIGLVWLVAREEGA